MNKETKLWLCDICGDTNEDSYNYCNNCGANHGYIE